MHTDSLLNDQHASNWLPLVLLRASSFLCFAGWTWVHLYWEAPYGNLFWHEGTYALAERWGIQWEEFVGTGANDGLIQKWSGRIGWLYLGCAIISLTATRRSRFQCAGLIFGSGLLAILSYAKFVGADYQPPMLIEHGGQILAPVLLAAALWYGTSHRVTVLIAIVALIMTFAGHGAYAMGIWPTPSHFTAMTRLTLGVDYDSALRMVYVAGLLDLLICVGIFTPLQRYCLFYAVVWGLLTAIARPVSGMSTDLNYWGADQYLHEAILRAPHFLIPAYLAMVWKSRNADSKDTG